MDHKLRKKTKIPCVDNLYRCPANGCDIESKYKHNIVQHLKMCVELKKERNTNNKVCPNTKSNRDKHVKNFHQDSEDDIVIDNQRGEDTQIETKPSMILAIDTVPPEVSQSLAPELPVPNHTNPEEEVLPPNEQMEDLSSRNTKKNRG